MNDAMLKLQESENRVEQERLQAEEQQQQIKLGTMKRFWPILTHPVR